MSCQLALFNRTFGSSPLSVRLFLSRRFSSCFSNRLSKTPRFSSASSSYINSTHPKLFRREFPSSLLTKTRDDHNVFNETRRFQTFRGHLLSKETVQFNLSDIGEGIGEVTIKEWYVDVGKRVNQFDSVCEVQSDKASVTITSRFDGVIKKLYYSVDDTAKVGLPLIDIEISSTTPGVNETQVDEVNGADASFPSVPISTGSQEGSSDKSDFDTYRKALTTPAVRRLAQEMNVNLSDIRGTGREGRILKEDVLRYIEIKTAAKNLRDEKSAISSSKSSAPSLPRDSLSNIPEELPVIQSQISGEILTSDKTEPITGIRKAMVKNMTLAQKIPHLGLGDDIDMSLLVDLKPQIKKISQEHNVKLTYISFMVKAVSESLKQFPILNASLNDECDAIKYWADHNIGVAMDTPHGLVVPIVKRVQNLSIVQVAAEIQRLQEKGLKGQLSLDDMSGGTFTISNIGSVGGSFGIPVILPPQVVIGAVGRIDTIPKYNSEGILVKSHVLKVVWSADHRIIDGATITRFNNLWKSYMQDLTPMFLNMK